MGKIEKKQWDSLNANTVYLVSYAANQGFQKAKAKDIDLEKAYSIYEYTPPNIPEGTVIIPKKLIKGIPPGDFEAINQACNSYLKSKLGADYSLGDNADTGLVSVIKFVEKKEGFTAKEYLRLTGYHPGTRYYDIIQSIGQDGKIYQSTPMGNVSAQYAVAEGKEPYTKPKLTTKIWAKTSIKAMIEGVFDV